MNPFQIAFMGGLVAIIVLQLINKVWGAGFALLWCVGVGAYGYWLISNGTELSFFGQPVGALAFVGLMTAMAAYNGWSFMRALKARRA